MTGCICIIFQTATADGERFCQWLCGDIALEYDWSQHMIKSRGKSIKIHNMQLEKPLGNSV